MSVKNTGEKISVRYQDEHIQFEELGVIEEEEEESNGRSTLRKQMDKDRAFQEFARKYY